MSAQRLLGDVASMGPLMSLLKANAVRGEFLRINRDITGTFGLLAAGEQLLVRTQAGRAAATQPDLLEAECACLRC